MRKVATTSLRFSNGVYVGNPSDAGLGGSTFAILRFGWLSNSSGVIAVATDASSRPSNLAFAILRFGSGVVVRLLSL